MTRDIQRHEPKKLTQAEREAARLSQRKKPRKH